MSGKERFDREFALAAGRIAARAIDSFVERLAFVGSYRRLSPNVGDIDILVTLKPGATERQVNSALSKVCRNRSLLTQGAGMTKGEVQFDGAYVPVNVFFTKPSEWGAALMYTTGSRGYNIKYRSIAKHRGLTVNQYGVFRDGKLIPDSGFSERAVCRTIGISWIHPSEREK